MAMTAMMNFTTSSFGRVTPRYPARRSSHRRGARGPQWASSGSQRFAISLKLGVSSSEVIAS